MSKYLRDLIQARKHDGHKLLSIYTTAGFPEKNNTVDIILALDKAGVDFVELGMPFSDPIADGPIIQNASDKALRNGINTGDIFRIIKCVREKSRIPILLMGYANTLLQPGLNNFISQASQAGADGLIIPDWPLEESIYALAELEQNDLDLVHLIAPNTPTERIRRIDAISKAFVYCVAYTGVTGRDNKPTGETLAFFDTLKRELINPWLVGFGIKKHADYRLYNKYSDGVIIGTAFIRLLESTKPDKRAEAIMQFVKEIRG